MELSAAFDSKLSELRKFVQEQNYDEVENLWIEIAELPEATAKNLETLVALAREMEEQGYGSRAGALLELLLPGLVEADAPPDESMLALYRLLAKLLPERREYRIGFAECFEGIHGIGTPERAFYECCGIRESGDSRASLERLERLMEFSPGACVYHAAGWGIGEVLEVDPLLKQVKVNLAGKPDHRIAIEAVDSILEPLRDDHFRALRYRNADELARLAREEPLELVDRMLTALGSPLALKVVKAQLAPDVIPSSEWNRWWSAAKKRLRESGFFRVGDSAPYLIEKLDNEISYEDDLLERFASGNWTARRQVARMVFRSGGRRFPRAVVALREELARLAAEGEDPCQSIESGLLLLKHDAEGEGKEAMSNALARLSTAAAVAALEGLSQLDDVRRGLASLVDARPEAMEEALRLAYCSRSDTLREAACGILEERNAGLLGRLSRDLLRSPRLGPEGFCWLVEQKLGKKRRGPAVEALEGLSPREIVGLLLDLLDHLVDRSARRTRTDSRFKDAIRRVERILYHGEGRYFVESLEGVPASGLREIHSRLVRSADYLPRHAAKLIESVSAFHPDVGRDSREEHVWWQDDAIYVTAEGLARRKAEFRALTEERIPANFEAVGKAADLGDLSENAEFTSALEEQDLLTKQAARMKDELTRARVLRPEDVRKGAVSLGSKVRVRDLDSGEDRVYSILGPWDGLPDEGVLSYLSPLGKIFLGKKEDEVFGAELPGGTKSYRVLEIGSHFE